MSLGRSLNAALKIGEEIRFKQRHQRQMQELARLVHFTFAEVQCLCLLYHRLQLVGGGGGRSVPVRRSLVKDVLHKGFDMTDARMAACAIYTCDKSMSPYMSMDNWVKMLSIFLRGTLEEKIAYCFEVYKSVGMSDKLIRNNMVFLLKDSLVKENEDDNVEEEVKDLVDMIVKKMDHDRDGKISFEDYRESVLLNLLLLQAFGPVLPSRPAVYAFKMTFTKNVGKK